MTSSCQWRFPLFLSWNYQRTISLEIPMSLIFKISLKITCLKFRANLPVAIELMYLMLTGLWSLEPLEIVIVTVFHDDVIKWKHFPHYWPFVRGIHRFTVNSQHKGQWRGALMFSLICVWINSWVNNREAGDLRCYRPPLRRHCNVAVRVTAFKALCDHEHGQQDGILLHCYLVLMTILNGGNILWYN